MNQLQSGIRALLRRQAFDTKAVFKRLQHTNQLRLERARSLLGPRQQLFLDFLPLFFHCNHPALPGYQSLGCPAGISHYHPPPEMVERVKRHLAESFQLSKTAHAADLEAIYLMGSMGSIAHAPSSDIDVWVCHQSRINADALATLRKKCDDLSHYATVALGLEVHFFLMSAEEFRAGERRALNAEDCGSTQHFLLLDEFYRSAIRLAGKYPLWWLIPADARDYDEAVAEFRRKHRRLAAKTLDFGNIHQIPPGEYVGAGIWQLFKAIRTPHKSLIKLLLIEAYAREHPANAPLSHSIKYTLQQPKRSADLPDPYQLMYFRIEGLLKAHGEDKRLDLLRRALYFKTELKLSRITGPGSWREQALRALTDSWGWSADHLRNLDMRDTWRVHRVREEHLELVRELTGSYRFLQEFAAQHDGEQLISSREMNVLGRKLFAAFERQPGKIDWINSDIADDLAEKNLSFCYLGKSNPAAPSWALIAGKAGLASWHGSAPLRESESLPALICWCLCNGLINGDTRFHLASDHPDHERGKLEALVKILETVVPRSAYATHAEHHERFESPRFTESLTCIVGNSSQRNSYDIPVIRHLDVITVSSWGEVICKAHIGEDAAAQALHQITAVVVGQSVTPTLAVHPFSANADVSARDFQRDLDPLLSFFSGAQEGDRYIYESGNAYYQFQRRHKTVRLNYASNFTQLASFLAKSANKSSRIEVSRANSRLSILARIAQLQSQDEINIVFQQREEAADIYILDGHGAIHYQPLLCDNSGIMLGQLKSFIMSLRKQYFRQYPVAWYELSEQLGQYYIAPLKREPESDRLRIGVSMLSNRAADASYRFDLNINQKTLHFAQYGKDILKHAALYIRNQWPSQPLRFCYVHQIQYRDSRQEDVNISARLAEALRHKAQIEEALNSALLAEVSPAV